MKVETRLRRLHAQHPGWLFFHTTTGPGPARWTAAPYAYRVDYVNADFRGIIAAATPDELRRMVRDRYGWYDHCETCGVLARECGHRQPEQEKSFV